MAAWVVLASQPVLAQTVCPSVPDGGLYYVYQSHVASTPPPGQSTYPTAATIDSSGRIIVTNGGVHSVAVFDASGTFLFEFGSFGSSPGQFNFPTGVAAGPSGEIVVADNANHRIQVFDSTGAFQFQFGGFGSSPGAFLAPWGVAVDATGRILVADQGNHRVQVFSSAGAYLFEFGGAGSGPGQFAYPLGVAVDGLGRIVVLDSQNYRVQIFDSGGTYLSQFGSYGSGDGQFNYSTGVAADAAGNIAVCDTYQYRIAVFDSTGAFLTNFGSTGQGLGQFSTAQGVAMSATGSILVANSGNNRVDMFIPTTNAGDTDGDGTPNCLDACPADLSKLAPGSCGCGIPDTDSDGDTYADCVEQCPLDPGKIYPMQCGCGIPDTDTDGDFTADCVDQCSLDPGKTTPGICGCGVSDIDADGDGSADCQDICVGVTDGPDLIDRFGDLDDDELFSPGGTAVDSAGRILVADRDMNRIEVYDPNGQPLFHFGSAGAGSGQFSQPLDVAVDASNRIYVADTNNQRVQVFDSTGAFQFAFGGAFSPTAIAVDSTGRILVGDVNTTTIQIFDSTGVFLSSFGTYGTGPGQLTSISGLAIDASGNILTADFYFPRVAVFDPTGAFLYEFGNGIMNSPLDLDVDVTGRVIVSQGNQRISIFDPSGFLLTQFGSFGLGNGQFYSPWGVVTDASSRILVADRDAHRMQVFDSFGVFLFKIGEYNPEAPGKFFSAQDVAVDGTGRIIAADSLNGRVQAFDPNGSFLFSIGGVGYPLGVAVDSADRILVAEYYGARILVYNSSGALQFQFGSSGSGPGQFIHQGGVATGAGDRILVADWGNHRIQVFDSGGVFLFEFGSYGTGPGQFRGPRDVAEDAAGRILVADGDNSRIQVFDSNGVYLSSIGGFGTGDGQFYYPSRVTTDALGRIIALDSSLTRIQVFDSTGTFLFKFGAYGFAPGQLSGANGVDLDDAGRFYSADGNRIQIFAPIPNSADSDGDGAANCNDGCPQDSAKLTPGTCGCGVADADADLDSVTDCVDNCPLVANPGQEDADHNGVGDACQACAPSAEICDGLDNDCDGTPDDGNPGGGASCATGIPGVCAPGVSTCTGGSLQCSQTVFASAEVCDGLDNDCDGAMDEQVVSGNVMSLSDGAGGYPTLTAVVPISLTDVTGQGVLSADLTVTWNPAIMQATLVSPGSLIASPAPCTLTSNLNTPGRVTLSIFCSTELSGSGTLAEVTFQVLGAPGSSSPLSLVSTQLNEGTPRVCLDDGQFSVAAAGDIAGKILYYHDSNTNNEPSGLPVSGAAVALTGTGPAVPASSVTAAAGTYGFTARPLVQDYRTLPSKAGDFRGAISSFDAALVARHVVTTITLTPNQRIAGDVTGNGSLSSLDAAHIAQFAVGLITQMPVAGIVGSDWFFVPAAAPVVNQTVTAPSGAASGRIDYNPLVTPAPDQDYHAGLYGDVSGNFVNLPPLWAPGGDPEALSRGRVVALGGAAPSGRSAERARLRLATGKLQPDNTLEVRVMVSGADTAVSFDLNLGYDASLFQVESVETGQAASRFSLAHAADGGSLRVALYGTEPLGGNGALAVIRLKLIGAPGSSVLDLSASVDEGRIPATTAPLSVRARPRREPQRQ